MNRRGATVVELVIGIGTAAILAIVSASLFRAGIKAYSYTARQNAVLDTASKALEGQGSLPGILAGIRASRSVSTLSSNSVVVLSTGGASTTFSLTGTDLYRAAPGKTSLLASGVTSLGVSYFNLNSSTGLIMESTAAVSATLVVTTITVTGYGDSDKAYTFFSGARLRNW